MAISIGLQLLHTNASRPIREPFRSPLTAGNANLFVDFAGLYSKSKRRKRRLGALGSRRAFTHYVPKSSSSVTAVLELEPTDKSLRDSAASSSDSKPEVRLVLIVFFVCKQLRIFGVTVYELENYVLSFFAAERHFLLVTSL